MAKSAEMGGAVGVRVNGPVNIRAVRCSIHLPIIGIYKLSIPGFEPYITPSVKAAQSVATAGADIIALDATNRPHPQNLSAAELIRAVKAIGLPVMADISTFEEGVMAAESGADLVGTTLSGYTQYSSHIAGPDFELVERLANVLDIPVIAEGRIWSPDDARKAVDLGAYAVVVGTAITRPWLLTARFVDALKGVTIS